MSLVPSMLKYGIVLLALLGTTGSAMAGAWLRSEGEVYASMDVSFSSASYQWDDHRHRERADCTERKQRADLNAEYGYSYYHTLFAQASMSLARCSGEPDSSGLSDLTLGVRGRLDPFRNGRSWELALKLPVTGQGGDTERPGNDEFGVSAGVHFRLEPDPYDNPAIRYRGGVWNAGVGVRLWTGGVAHQGWGYVGWDHGLGETWRFSSRLYAVRSFGASRSAQREFRDNDYDALNASVSFGRPIDRDTSFSIGISHDLWGRNTDQDFTIKLGISRYWR